MCSVHPSSIKENAHVAKLLNRLTSKNLPHVLPMLDAAQLAAFEYRNSHVT